MVGEGSEKEEVGIRLLGCGAGTVSISSSSRIPINKYRSYQLVSFAPGTGLDRHPRCTKKPTSRNFLVKELTPLRLAQYRLATDVRQLLLDYLID